MSMLVLAILQVAAAQAAPILKPCDAIDPGDPAITFDQPYARQGATIRVRPMVAHASWYGSEEVRRDCYEDWRVDDPAAARFDAATGMLTILDGAKPGSDIIVRATFRTTPIIKGLAVGRIRVVGRAEPTLVGVWTEAGRDHCTEDRIAELAFGPVGYSFTYPESMIETMTSGGGRYRWDAATGGIALDDRHGTATLAGEMLTITGITFGVARPMVEPRPGSVPEPACILRFRRVEDR